MALLNKREKVLYRVGRGCDVVIELTGSGGIVFKP